VSATGVVPRILHAELSEYRRQLRDARADAEMLVDGLTDAQFNWSPAPGRWSIAECLDHLNSGWKVLPKLDYKIASASEQGVRGEGPYRHPFLGRLYIRFMEPPPKIRVSAPKAYVPKPDQPLAEVAPRFLELQDEIIRRVIAADGLDLGEIRMSSPISRRFRMSLGQWFAFLAAHERRHLWQAWQVRKHPEFPA
jgi:DinB superfamily